MSVALLVVIVLAVAVVVAAGVTVVRSGTETTIVIACPIAEVEDVAERRARQSALEDLGETLLERRVELDTRRGTLGGNAALYDALDALESRYQAGEIGEQEFEAEKLRLLSEGS